MQTVSDHQAAVAKAAQDPGVRREIRRYQALRAIGWTSDLCPSCRRKIQLRAGAEDCPTAPNPDVLLALAAEATTVAAISTKIARGARLSAQDQQRLITAARRIDAARRILDGSR